MHQVTKVLELQLRISPSNEYSGLIYFRIDWFDLLAVQGTLKGLFQKHSSKASIIWHLVFFIVQLSHPYMTTEKTVALTRWSFVGKVMSPFSNMLPKLVFPVFMYGCESWTLKKAELRRIDAFELWCWRRLVRVPWTARRSNQSILKEISAGCSLEGLMLKLKLQYLATSCEELTHWKKL